MEKSIYELISENIADGVLKPGFSLPEESDSAPVKFAPGAFDGICIYHMGLDELDDEGRAALGEALASASTGKHEQTDALFFEWTKKHRAIGMVDEIQNYVREHKEELKIGYMYQSAKYMILHSPHIECVKIGLELLELFRAPFADVEEAVRVLALCDEFTIFAVWNIRKWEDGNLEIFDLAKKVHGWGRIHAIEFLEADTEEIRRWLLTEGKAQELATELGLPFREDLLRAMRSDFEHHCGKVCWLMNDGDYYAEQAMALFRERLPLAKMKGDPVDDLCLGDEYRNHNILQNMIQELDGRIFVGTDFVQAGLASPVSRNRNRALKVLQAWVKASGRPLAELSQPLYQAVQTLRSKEINAGARFLADPLLEGKTEFEDEKYEL